MSTYANGYRMRTWPSGGLLFILLGVVWIVFGLVLIGSPMYGTLAAVWLFGILLVVGGVLHAVHAFLVRAAGGAFCFTRSKVCSASWWAPSCWPTPSAARSA